MADRHVVADLVGYATVAVNHGTVLDVDALANSDWRDVAANDGVEPEAGEFADGDVADDGRVVSEEKSVRSLRKQCHAADCSGSTATRASRPCEFRPENRVAHIGRTQH